jgi:ABC-type oligopeptide transport system substrate-binding subunit
MGINTRMTVLPDLEFFARLRSGDFDLFISRWGCVTTDASELFENCFYRRGVREGYGVANYTRYGTAETDREIDESGLAPDPERRIKLLQNILKRITADHPWIPLYINRDQYAISHDVLWQPRLDSRVNASEFVSAR